MGSNPTRPTNLNNMNFHQFKLYLVEHSLDDVFQVINPEKNYIDDWFYLKGTDYIVHFWDGDLDWFFVESGKPISKRTFDEVFDNLPSDLQAKFIFHFDVFRVS